MNEITLRELCERQHVSRRAVQGYEAMGLVKHSQKNSRGYLLYDINEERRVHEIRTLQQFGFTLKQIREIIDAPVEVKRKALRKRADELRREYEIKGEYIRKIEQMISNLITDQ